jgi:hypothetical protein
MDEENSVVATHWSLGTDFSVAVMAGSGEQPGWANAHPPHDVPHCGRFGMPPDNAGIAS